MAIPLVFKNSKVAIVLSSSFLLFFIYISTFYNREIQADEPWFIEQAYWFFKNHTVKLLSMPGILSFDHEMHVFHQLYIYLAAGILKVFGLHLVAFRISTLATLVLLCCSFFSFLSWRRPLKFV